MASNESKKVNFLVPQELFDRFLAVSEKEYKSTTGILTEWMATYVREREKKQEDGRMRAMMTALGRISDVLFNLTKSEPLSDKTREAITAISDLILSINKDPSNCDSPEFTTRLIEIERQFK